MSTTFEQDARLQQVAEAYAQDAIDFARAHYSKRLDWSDDSVRHVEEIAAHLHNSLPDPPPPEEEILAFAKMFGSYVGEVFRRNHGAAWGLVALGDQKVPGLKGSHDGVTFWPWVRVHKRLVNGPEDNVWHYYQLLISEHVGPAAPAPPPWWKRLFS